MVIVAHALLGYALVAALGIDVPRAVDSSLKLFEIRPEPPPAPVEKPPPRKMGTRKKGAPAPPNLKADPSQVVAPKPDAPILPPPIVAPPIAGTGSAPSAGAADIAGPGTGSGGEGTGMGGGGTGDGDFTPPRWLRGHIRDWDFPREAGEGGLGRTITVRFTVEANGRATNCTVMQSSGNVILDDATCRVIEKRYRYEPSRDGNGTPVSSTVVEDHNWMVETR